MAPKTIVLKGHGIRKERVANAAITPGHLVELMSTDKVRVHAGAGLSAQRAFAVEDDLQGNGITDAYSALDRVQFNVMAPGEEVYAILADGESVAKGDKLESAGDGTLRKVDTDSSAATIEVGSIVGISLDTLDLSDSSLADPSSARLAVEIF